MRKFAILAMVGVFSLTGCGMFEVVDNGKVTEKRFTPAKEWWEDQDITEEECGYETKTTMVNGKSKTKSVWDCDTEVVGTEKVKKSSPAKYELLLRQDDGDTGTVTVSKTVYTKTKVGSFYGKAE